MVEGVEDNSNLHGMGLIERAKVDHLAFEKLYNVYFSELYRYAYKRVGHRETTEDIISVAFTKVFTNLDSYTGDEKGFKAWLYRITTNTIIDHYRKQGTRKDTPIEKVEHQLESPLTTDKPTQDLLTKDNLNRALAKLSKADQEIIHLKYFAQYSNQEIAAHLKITDANCGVKLYRALKRLRSAYSPYAG